MQTAISGTRINEHCASTKIETSILNNKIKKKEQLILTFYFNL